MPWYRVTIRTKKVKHGKAVGLPLVLCEPSAAEAEATVRRRIPTATIVDVCRVEEGVEVNKGKDAS